MQDAMRLVVDIGGTNARLALVAAGSLQPQHEKTVRCAEYDSLEHAVRRYLQDRGNPEVREAALDVATGITGDFVHLTNGPWGFSIQQTRRALALDRLHVVNDFTALALAVPTLRPEELQQIGVAGTAVPATPIAVIGPGTGLGVSALIPAGSGWSALQGEGGHTAFSPMNKRELEVLGWLLGKYEHVSTERVSAAWGWKTSTRRCARWMACGPSRSGRTKSPQRHCRMPMRNASARWICFAPFSVPRLRIWSSRWVPGPAAT